MHPGARFAPCQHLNHVKTRQIKALPPVRGLLPQSRMVPQDATSTTAHARVRAADALPNPRRVEIEHIDIGAPKDRVWEAFYTMDLAASPLVRALFVLRTLGDKDPLVLRVRDIGRTGKGFMVLADEPGVVFAAGAIGRFWERHIPFADVPPERFAAFDEPGYGKVAWEVRLVPMSEHITRVVVEVRIDATDDAAWAHVRRYFRVIGPFSRFIRRHMLGLLASEVGSVEDEESKRPLPGDDIIPSPAGAVTMGITINAPPSAVWPWLVQMGADRAGFYSYDTLDNNGQSSARTIVMELQDLRVGDTIRAVSGIDEGWIVRALDAPRLMVLHGLFDTDERRQVKEGEPKPERYWEVTWVFFVEPLEGGAGSRLITRARAGFSGDQGSIRALAESTAHAVMEAEQLRNIKRRAEGKMAKHEDTWHDVGDGISGALSMLFDLSTPFLRSARTHWGLTEEEANRAYPGDDLLPNPRWGYTHAVDINASAADVWPYVAQIGQEKAGFYSYQWLENLAGCDVQNTDLVHREWQSVAVGDTLRLHPQMPPMRVVALSPGHFMLVGGGSGSDVEHGGVHVSWLFLIEPRGEGGCRLVSRYRVLYGDDLKSRLAYGPALIEPISFAMDTKMLTHIRELAERQDR